MHRFIRKALSGAGFLLLALHAPAADFVVTNGLFQSFYTINNLAPSPTITLQRGRTYTFNINTSTSHPFKIGTSVGGAAPGGISGQNPGGNSSGTITWTVPTNAVNYAYFCAVHLFSGTILTEDPPPPPAIKIVGFSFSNNIVLRSTGANGVTLVPEFKTNLNTT